MIKYNWKETKELCKNDKNTTLHFFAQKYNIPKQNLRYLRPLSTRENNRIEIHRMPPGLSYLINPYTLLLNLGEFSAIEIYDYIHLASCRLYFDWVVRKDCTIHYTIAKAEGINVDKNSLLTRKNNLIYFKYEQEITEVI